MISKRLALLVSLVMCLLSAVCARAEDDSQYQALIAQGISEWEHHNWPETRALFSRAHQLNPNARTLRGMGVASFEMRDYVNAVVQLGGALEDARKPLTDVMRAECEQLLMRARAFVGTYAVSLEPKQATLLLDGTTPTRDGADRVLVPFGEHTVKAVADDYLEQAQRLNVQGGEQAGLSFVLRKITPVALAAPPLSAATPAATVYEKRGGLRYTWVALGATAAFGAAAIASWFVGQSKLDDLDAKCAQRASTATPCLRGSVDTGSIRTLQHTTNALLGVTGAALAATIAIASFEWPRERKTMALELGPQRVALRGSF